MNHSTQEKSYGLREPPPRRLDWYTSAVILLGDFVSQTGWGLLALGSVFFWTTAVNSEVRYFFERHHIDWESKAGVILKADSTAAVEGKNSIWQYQYSFALGEYRYKGVSYSVGKKFDAGQIAYIQYDPVNPATSSIVGLRRSPYNWHVNLLLLIPLAGFILVLWPIRRNLRFLRLLRQGDFTRGVLVEKKATGQSVKDGLKVLPVFRYHFRFEYKDAVYHASCTTHHPHLVEDESAESLLFDRYNPSFNLVYDAVPNVPAINALGKMERSPAVKSWVLFFPAFTVFVNLVFALLS